MNILFVQREYNPTHGGVQRVSKILFDFFSENNNCCYFLLMDDHNNSIANLDAAIFSIITPRNYDHIAQFVKEKK